MSTSPRDKTYLYPNEPTRFTPQDLDLLFGFCERAGTSDITLQTGQPVVAEINGKLYRVTTRELSNTEVGEMLNAIYGPNGTTQILSGKDVDTHYEIRPARGERYRFRINATGCQIRGHDGIQITARTIPNDPPTLAQLGVEDEILKNISPEEGVVYVTGATGSGKSTLLAGVIREIAEDQESHRKILTYESPIEFVYDEVETPTSVISQSEIPRHLPSFAAGVRNALRRKPRLILVGEARDQETMSAVLEAALTGHPVYTTLHSNSVSETVRRLVTTFPAEERHGRTVDIVETLRVIICQKLVPTVDGKRVALREYLVFDEAIRDKLLDYDPENITAATRELVKTHGQTMLTDIQRKYDEGRISERAYKVLTAGTVKAE